MVLEDGEYAWRSFFLANGVRSPNNKQLLYLQGPPAPSDPVKPTGPESPPLLDFEQDEKTEFDPLASGQTSTSELGLLSELSSLEAPKQSSSASLLLPTQTTPFVATQADCSSAFGLTADLAPTASTSVPYIIGLSTSGIGMNSLHTAGSMSMVSTGGVAAGVANSGLQVPLLSEAFWWILFILWFFLSVFQQPLGGSTYSPTLMNRQVS